MEALPQTIYIAAGAILAALISGYWSFVNLIVSKDQKVSEFRQSWIDQLRDDVSDYVSIIHAHQAAYFAYIKINEMEENRFHKFILEHKADIQKISSLESRIKLRLNHIDDQSLLTLVDDIDRYITNSKELRDGDKIIITINSLVSLTQKLLKEEWGRVKSGEKGFRYTRNTSFILVIGAITALAYINA